MILSLGYRCGANVVTRARVPRGQLITWVRHIAIQVLRRGKNDLVWAVAGHALGANLRRGLEHKRA